MTAGDNCSGPSRWRPLTCRIVSKLLCCCSLIPGPCLLLLVLFLLFALGAAPADAKYKKEENPSAGRLFLLAPDPFSYFLFP